MKVRLLLLITVLALIFSAVVPAVAVAAPPTQFSAVVIPGQIELIKQTPLGNSGRFLAEERISGVIVYSTWDLLEYAAVEMNATTNYVQYPTGDREGVMRGRMVINSVRGGTLELVYSAKISGPGGCTFDGHWAAVDGTGVFKGIKASGKFLSNPAGGIPPTFAGTWN